MPATGTHAQISRDRSVEINLDLLNDMMLERLGPQTPKAEIPAMPAIPERRKMKQAPLPAAKPTPPQAEIPQTEKPQTEKLQTKRPQAAPTSSPVTQAAAAQSITLNYTSGEIAASDTAKNIIKTQIIPLLNQNPAMRASLISFATPADEGQSSDRRISLARAIALRETLVAAGIAPERIDLMPRGNSADTLPHDRIDVVLEP